MPILFALAGAVIGLAADAIAHRWPAHDEDHARNRFDWRTAVVVAAGAVAFYGLASRWGADVVSFVIYFVLFAALTVLLATDLDQRKLPDVVTLPLVAFAALALVLGASPELTGKEFGMVSGLAAGLIAPVVLLVTDRVFGGDLGLGDVKLSISLGLFFGISALFYGMLIASMGFALVLLGLIALRRIGLKSAIPFGPVLIFAAFIAALAA